MTILITGSRGKTALPLTELVASKFPVLVASRAPRADAPHPTVRFDWHDPTSWELVFTHPEATASAIDRIYLVGPDEVDTGSDHLIAFMRFAREKGVKRMVLLSAWEIPPGGVLMGRAHQALKVMGEEGMEWAVLRPNFFMENFVEGYHRESIKAEGKLFSGAADGRLAFISAQDIAAVAYRALTDTTPHNTEHVITGPEALSYDQVAATLSDVLGKEIEHIRLSPQQLQQTLLEGHLQERMAKYMVDLDITIANGAGTQVTGLVEKVTGRKPTSLREFVEGKKDVWR